jgi:import receptor subunit TOM20
MLADFSPLGPELHVEAATHFYRALRVYPQPVELLMSE